MKRLKRHRTLLRTLIKATPSVRRKIIASGSDDFIKSLCECCLNTLNGNTKIKPSAFAKLKRYKNVLRQLGFGRLSLLKKRKLLIQKGGFLPLLLSSLGSILTGALSNLIR
nr:TPA_asm: gasderminX [Ladona dragonfly adintovirus]